MTVFNRIGECHIDSMSSNAHCLSGDSPVYVLDPTVVPDFLNLNGYISPAQVAEWTVKMQAAQVRGGHYVKTMGDIGFNLVLTAAHTVRLSVFESSLERFEKENAIVF